MCHAQTRKENFNSMRLSYPDPIEIFSLIILNDILLMHKPVGVRRSIILQEIEVWILLRFRNYTGIFQG